MTFYKLKYLLKSWSVWVLGLVTVTPVLNEETAIFNFIPEEYKPFVITLLGILGLIVRSIKQFPLK